MNLSGTWLRPNDRASQRKGHRFFLSIIFAGLAITLLLSAFGKLAPSIIEKTRLASLLSPISQGRLKVIEHHAVSGDWLDEINETRTGEKHTTFISTEIKHIRQGAVHIEIRNRKFSLLSSEWWPTRFKRIQQGIFHMEDHNRNFSTAHPEWWSIRPAVMGDDAPTVLWVCGSQLPHKGFHALGEDLTTVPPEENFWLCR
ncbi:MAG: hypothetical protein LBE75_04725 [Burkholderiales bacterium]|jgi:hypothetical protein|nr:hypothetical protein [Burkholderiales bacterium]